MRKIPFDIEKDFVKIGFSVPMNISRMLTGSASENYHIKNSDGDFLVKILKNPLDSKSLLNNLLATSGEKFCPFLLSVKKLNNKDFFVFKWIEGKNIFLDKLSDENFKNLILSYKIFLSVINKKVKKEILFKPTLQEKYNKIKNLSVLMRHELNEIKKDLNYEPKLQVIHGDLNYKNLIFNKGKFQSFLDFQEFSWGIPTEDLIRLILTNAEQHRFFRKKFTVNLLKMVMENTSYSKEEWFYGLNIFILTKYEKKLRKKGLIKNISIIRCNILYKQIRKEISLFWSSKKI